MEEDNKYIKRQKIYKIIMLMILTAFVTSILTAIYIVKLDGNTQTTNNSGVSSILNVLTSDSNLTKSLKGIETIVKSKYLNESDIDETSAIDGAIEGYINSLGDEYAEYIPADKMKEYTEGIMGNFVGIGIYMIKNTEKDLVQVLSPIRESPAEKAGIKAGDLITKVNGVSYTADQMSEMANTIKGEEGSKVTIEVLRGEQILTFEVTREKVNTNPVYSEKLENDIGYLEITSFDEGVAEDFKAKYLSLKEQGIKGLVIDLRDNPGGLLDVCVDIADDLIGEGTIVYTKDNKGETQYYKSDKNKVDLPIVVLINENSASASEILTEAIVDNKAGIAVGTTSYGKGLVQSVREFNDGTGYKLTTAQYYTPNGDYINKQGIKPDIVEKDKEKQLDRAIEYIKKNK